MCWRAHTFGSKRLPAVATRSLLDLPLSLPSSEELIRLDVVRVVEHQPAEQAPGGRHGVDYPGGNGPCIRVRGTTFSRRSSSCHERCGGLGPGPVWLAGALRGGSVVEADHLLGVDDAVEVLCGDVAGGEGGFAQCG